MVKTGIKWCPQKCGRRLHDGSCTPAAVSSESFDDDDMEAMSEYDPNQIMEVPEVQQMMELGGEITRLRQVFLNDPTKYIEEKKRYLKGKSRSTETLFRRGDFGKGIN